jgi:rSAM/selenodomain-associated transferase 1
MRTLLIFIKNPIPGHTKTRLAATVGDERALRMYGRLLDYTRGVTQEVDARRLLFYSDRITADDDWPQADFEKHVQSGADLGERMENAFAQAFQDSDRVLIIGSDCPGIQPRLLERAFAALDNHDVVLGPAEDGGYYLLGLRRMVPALFRDMAWSISSVAQETRDRVHAAGLSLYELPVLRDVDYLEDWEYYGWTVPD